MMLVVGVREQVQVGNMATANKFGHCTYLILSSGRHSPWAASPRPYLPVFTTTYQNTSTSLATQKHVMTILWYHLSFEILMAQYLTAYRCPLEAQSAPELH